MLDYNNKPKPLHSSKSHNIYSDKLGKRSIYRSFTEWKNKSLNDLQYYLLTIKKTTILENLSLCFSAVLLVTFFYFLLVFFCAIDDQCAAIYMEVAHANS